MTTCDDADYPLNEWMIQVRQLKLLSESDVRKLCQLVLINKKVKSYLLDEPNVLTISSPITVCGDIRGQFYDLMELFNVAGHMEATNTNYLFLGNFVNRGIHSVETITYLLLLKAKYPTRISLLRGNTEARQITQVHGFYDEVCSKYKSPIVWQLCCEVFDHLPLAAVVDNKIFCVHGGLSPSISTIDDIRSQDRRREVPHDGPMCDLLWSDPEPISGWGLSNRGAGWIFGSDIVHEFNHKNGIDLICRSHQLVMEGYNYPYGEDKCLVTVFSTPNCMYRAGNLAAVMELDKNLNKKFKIFRQSDMNELKIGKSDKDEGDIQVNRN